MDEIRPKSGMYIYGKEVTEESALLEFVSAMMEELQNNKRTPDITNLDKHSFIDPRQLLRPEYKNLAHPYMDLANREFCRLNRIVNIERDQFDIEHELNGDLMYKQCVDAANFLMMTAFHLKYVREINKIRLTPPTQSSNMEETTRRPT